MPSHGRLIYRLLETSTAWNLKQTDLFAVVYFRDRVMANKLVAERELLEDAGSWVLGSLHWRTVSGIHRLARQEAHTIIHSGAGGDSAGYLASSAV